MRFHSALVICAAAGHRERSLGALFAPVDGEGDALVEESQVGGVFAAPDFVGGQRRERLQQRSVVRARFARAFKGLVIGVIDEIILQNRVVEAADFRQTHGEV